MIGIAKTPSLNASSRTPDMATTRTYLHLAGVVFRDEAERLEARLLWPTEPIESSTAPTSSGLISDDLNGSETRVLSG